MKSGSIEQLKKIPLFEAIPDEELGLIASKMELESYKKGDHIISAGDSGNYIYLIQKGRVKVLANLQDENDEIVLSYLEKGDHFGEMALITGEPRSATVIAESDLDVLKLGKSEFDNLLLKNPRISINLTHLLSQRLVNANIAREQTERYYKNKFIPKGRLRDTGVIRLLKYAEENSLSGKIIIKHDEKVAFFEFQKGQLSNLDFENKNEDAAMDVILEWSDGEYIIETNIFSAADEGRQTAKEEATSGEKMKIDEIFKSYTTEKFTELIHFSGSKSTQSALNRSYHRFESYFDISKEIQIKTDPELSVSITPGGEWSEKHTLFMAILLRDVIGAVERDVVGMRFWTPKSKLKSINRELEALQFFDYYDQATEFVKI
ncbi:MAG: Crp/Fnr family transcriptional regulator [Calditrichaceae bacterium]